MGPFVVVPMRGGGGDIIGADHDDAGIHRARNSAIAVDGLIGTVSLGRPVSA